MKDLIWYSIPGFIFLLPFTIAVEFNTTTLVFAIPIIGFIVHQTFRMLYEGIVGGFKSKNRKIVKEITNRYNNITDNTDAFLVWEMTFYSNNICESFRAHDRGAWHYIMSFYSCSFACAIGLLGWLYLFLMNKEHLIQSKLDINQNIIIIALIITYALVGLMFYYKGFLTKKSIEEQEIALIKIKDDDFRKIAESI